MEQLFRYFLAVICSIFIVGTATQISAQDQQKIRELYERMSNNQKSLTSLKARVRMLSVNPQIDDKTEKDGTVIYLPGRGRSANARIDWEKPETETLSVVNGEYKLYRPRLATMYVGKTKEAQKENDKVGGSLAFINMSGQQLKQNFSASWLEPELIANNSISAYHLKLTPKTAQRYNFAEIWVTEDGMPVQFKVVEKNGDTTTVLLYNIQKNAKVNKNDVAFNPPKNTKVIKS